MDKNFIASELVQAAREVIAGNEVPFTHSDFEDYASDFKKEALKESKKMLEDYASKIERKYSKYKGWKLFRANSTGKPSQYLGVFKELKVSFSVFNPQAPYVQSVYFRLTDGDSEVINNNGGNHWTMVFVKPK